jgi:hypothetical protein
LAYEPGRRPIQHELEEVLGQFIGRAATPALISEVVDALSQIIDDHYRRGLTLTDMRGEPLARNDIAISVEGDPQRGFMGVKIVADAMPLAGAVRLAPFMALAPGTIMALKLS